MLAQERAQQGGLPRPVATDDAEYAGPLQRSAEPLDQRPWEGADPYAHVLRADDLITPPLRDFEAHRHRPFGADDGAEPRQPLEPLAPAFCLFGVLTSDVAGDVVFLVCDRALLLVVRPLLCEPALGALRHERCVATGIRRSRVRVRSAPGPRRIGRGRGARRRAPGPPPASRATAPTRAARPTPRRRPPRPSSRRRSRDVVPAARLAGGARGRCCRAWARARPSAAGTAWSCPSRSGRRCPTVHPGRR